MLYNGMTAKEDLPEMKKTENCSEPFLLLPSFEASMYFVEVSYLLGSIDRPYAKFIKTNEDPFVITYC